MHRYAIRRAASAAVRAFSSRVRSLAQGERRLARGPRPQVLEALEARTLFNGSLVPPTLTASAVSSTEIDLAYSAPDGERLQVEQQGPGDTNFHTVATLNTGSGTYQ